MALVVRRETRPARLREIIRRIQVEPALTPRSFENLRKSRVTCAYDDGTLVGWLIAEPLRTGVYELGAAYVQPSYRNNGILGRLLDATMESAELYVAAIFNLDLLEYVVKKRQFRTSSLLELIRVSRGRFVTKRFGQGYRVARHVAAGRPHFVIRETHHG